VWKFLVSSKPLFLSGKPLALFFSVVVFVLLGGCTVAPPISSPVIDESGPEAALLYHQSLLRMTPAQLDRERMVLTAVRQTPASQLRMAMLLYHPKAQQDHGKAVALLENVLKSTDPAALVLHPLARLLVDNYQERARLEGQLGKQDVQLKDGQRKITELQDKLDSLADIERTLTPRPRAVRHEGGRP
jgi:hypothetical protein